MPISKDSSHYINLLGENNLILKFQSIFLLQGDDSNFKILYSIVFNNNLKVQHLEFDEKNAMEIAFESMGVLKNIKTLKFCVFKNLENPKDLETVFQNNKIESLSLNFNYYDVNNELDINPFKILINLKKIHLGNFFIKIRWN